MLSGDISILYVSNVMKSSDFYESLLGCKPVEKSPTFALFVLGNGFKLGLWSCYTVEPSAGQHTQIATGEIMFTVQSKEDVDAYYIDWGERNKVTVIQKPVVLDFGYAFAVIDPDGHRVRVCFLETE